MSEITLELDNKANQSIKDLMKHYNVKTKAEIISKAIAVLKTAAYVDKAKGELFARKGTHETKILIR